ncbi:MAG: AAA family ATPase [Deltaproteobacteria bacterium]|jgi:type VI secretion system protein VasG|nr:AAA family ATPase [Deltaproteobacteria bacterium]
MISPDPKQILRKLNSQTTSALYNATRVANDSSNNEVFFEHFLMKALDIPQTDINQIIDYFKIDRTSLNKSLDKALKKFDTGNSEKLSFSPSLFELLEASWLTASIEFGLPTIRTGTVLVSYLRRPAHFAQNKPLPELKNISVEVLEKSFFKIISNSSETDPTSEDTGQSSSKDSEKSQEKYIETYCQNFTQMAANGQLDPVIGRDNEIRSIISILVRRRKNNPVLVGDPGVGKTAVIEGLAMRINEGNVPDILKGVSIIGLDIGLMTAGTCYRGDFEKRLKGLIDEIKSSPKPIILFIDEAHMLVGAGDRSGGNDAANLMKPALARGELKTCAATTWTEYKKYFEKDPALTRRFQPVHLDEPDPETCIFILRGLRDYYEKSHGVFIRDEAIKAAVEMSSRYISDRYLPDKAIDLIDTACAKVKVGFEVKPILLEDAESTKEFLISEKKGLTRDNAIVGSTKYNLRLKAIDSELSDLNSKITKLTEAWQKQKTAVQNLNKAKINFFKSNQDQDQPDKKILSMLDPKLQDGTPGGSQEGAGNSCALRPRKKAPPVESAQGAPPDERGSPPYSKVIKATKAFLKTRAAFDHLPSQNAQIDLEVTEKVVAEVISDWTGIPVGRLATEQAGTIANLDNLLQNRIKGQVEAVKIISREIKAAKAGLRDQRQPIGVFLLVGPSGVGKTETGLALADLLFNDNNIINLSMSEFQENHTVSKLIGAPPGYIGYGQGGLLTEAVRRKPYSVIIIDELEKAHIDVLNLFSQIFENGLLTDSEGKQVNFSNTIFVLTSNLASEIIDQINAASGQTPAKLAEAIRPVLANHFKPALMARMTLVPYTPLSLEAITFITEQKLADLALKIKTNNSAEFIYSKRVVTGISERCQGHETGARKIDYILSSSIIPLMAKEILSHMSKDVPFTDLIKLDLTKDNAFKLTFESR